MKFFYVFLIIKNYQDKLNDSFTTILEHKNYLYNIDNKLENNILYPIDINRICKNKCLNKDEDEISNVSPLYILEQNDKILKKNPLAKVQDTPFTPKGKIKLKKIKGTKATAAEIALERQRLAKKNIEVFEEYQVDAILVNAAGCGKVMF